MESQNDQAESNEPKGLGGWLILPMLGLIIAPVRLIIQIVKDLLPAFAPETWNALTTPDSPVYHHLWAPVIILETVSSIGLLLFSVWLLVLFFKKSIRLPKLFITWLILAFVIQILDQILANQIPAVGAQNTSPEAIKDLFRAFIAMLIWVPYFIRSKRVKNTFTQP